MPESIFVGGARYARYGHRSTDVCKVDPPQLMLDLMKTDLSDFFYTCMRCAVQFEMRVLQKNVSVEGGF